ncbi:unnamed protein product [Penicillium nalgiovense]|uniref:Zn(2)-C6 fungal-type domain-containing protein n=2 Tax=Penicillium nalgiovense TaxID=60175 RepID=A0A9W4I1H7_PENNA|nr:unnamed protein product [Penicillium nalgiovense]CAG7979084.1 unnamed protein product [Penicillium nalgiovense]CAG7982301.1 unnamed protein product [Penicillium nalgiovense]CAG7983074.1 unnamed protein product [Penicillium nalgiovense]CAG7990543.1 unnamed protein product [Penicillium nalgiovense]
MMEDLSRMSRTRMPPRIERRRTMGDTPAGSWTSRTKPVTIACERCRRRKIRCDGETPCATCRRFSLHCVRPEKSSEGQAALEQRVQQLEARIVELSTGTPNPPVSYPGDNRSARHPSPPSLHLLTDLAPPKYADSGSESFGYLFPDSSPSTLDIPRIEVVDFVDNMSPLSSSYMSSTMSAAPNPLSPMFDGRLMPPNMGIALSPPMSMCPSPGHDPIPHLSPGNFVESPRSRRSSMSISEYNLDLDHSNLNFPMVDIGEDIRPPSFSFFPPPGTDNLSGMPTSVEIQPLLDIFLQKTPGMGYPLGHDMFQIFLDIIDGPSHRPDTHGDGYPVSMAKFHVYMAMAVGLRMKETCRPRELELLETCYRVAVEQIQSRGFWDQPLAGEAAVLLMLFAQASQQTRL